jgi:hypothetical protein
VLRKTTTYYLFSELVESMHPFYLSFLIPHSCDILSVIVKYASSSLKTEKQVHRSKASENRKRRMKCPSFISLPHLLFLQLGFIC